MMARVCRTLCLMLAFTAEIEIHASAPEWLTEPARCTFNDKGCALEARADKAALVWEEASVSAGRGAILAFPESQTAELIDGTVLVRVSEGKKVKLPMAILFGGGEILIERSGTGVEITCLRGEVFIKALGVGEELRLPAGYRQHLDAVTRQGHAQTGIPMTAPVASSVKKWWRLFQGSKAEFLPLAKEFSRLVNTNVGVAAEWHARLVQRELAAQAENERLAKERREREERERRKYRDLFRKMNYLGDELPD